MKNPIMFIVPAFIILAFWVGFFMPKNQQPQTDSLFDVPDQTGAYIRTDPDTDQQYIVVVTNSGVAICKRER